MIWGSEKVVRPANGKSFIDHKVFVEANLTRIYYEFCNVKAAQLVKISHKQQPSILTRGLKNDYTWKILKNICHLTSLWTESQGSGRIFDGFILLRYQEETKQASICRNVVDVDDPKGKSHLL